VKRYLNDSESKKVGDGTSVQRQLPRSLSALPTWCSGARVVEDSCDDEERAPRDLQFLRWLYLRHLRDLRAICDGAMAICGPSTSIGAPTVDNRN